MRGPVLGVGDFDSDNSGSAGPVLVVGVISWSQLGRQRRVGRVGQQGELELYFLAKFY